MSSPEPPAENPQPTSEQGNPNSEPDLGPRTPKRTPMACQFCRGRKLKCDGSRPSCANCNRRGFPCVYTPVSPQNDRRS